MCLGIPARLVEPAGHPHLVTVDMAGARRTINIGLLDDAPAPGDWLLVHMGFALSTMSTEEARAALRALEDERLATEELLAEEGLR